MQKQYVTPQCEIILIRMRDIIATSGEKTEEFPEDWLNGDFGA